MRPKYEPRLYEDIAARLDIPMSTSALVTRVSLREHLPGLCRGCSVVLRGVVSTGDMSTMMLSPHSPIPATVGSGCFWSRVSSTTDDRSYRLCGKAECVSVPDELFPVLLAIEAAIDPTHFASLEGGI